MDSGDVARMAKESSGNLSLKKVLLVGFITTSVVLILLIWVDGLVDSGSINPIFYRESVSANEAFFMTQTAVAENHALGTGTPEYKGKHKNQTQIPYLTPIPSPTIDWNVEEEDQ